MNKNKKTLKRQIRVRSKVKGTEERPRLSVFRSNKYFYAQLINDDKGKTLLSASEKQLEKSKEKVSKGNRAKALGILMAKKAIAKKITKVVFDRGSYLFHGRVKEFAEGSREGGLKF